MTGADDLIGWLIRSTKPGSTLVRERRMVTAGTWSTWIRPDCNAETMLAFARSGRPDLMARTRTMWTELAPLESNGAWPFYVGNGSLWINDHSEITIFLLRLAHLDPVNADSYRAAALRTAAKISTWQLASGLWPENGGMAAGHPMFAAHAIAALSAALPHAGDQAAGYRQRITSGLAAITALILSGGRIKTTKEGGGGEGWRPPSSDQAIVIRAYAMAQAAMPDAPESVGWAASRATLFGWFDQLLHPSGAIRNGLGTTGLDADVVHVTDHVYTTAFAIEAYLRSWEVDGTPALLEKAQAVANFASGNVWNSENPDDNGCLRGAFDLVAQDFDTSEIPQNGMEEGGGGVAYTGWSAAPVAAALFELRPTRRRGAALLGFM